MSTQNDLQNIWDILSGIARNPVARFSYTQTAIDSDIVDGVEAFDNSAEQNIPKSTETMYNPTVTDKGIRSQGASIPRMAWNHYIGRSSYNLNKLVQKTQNILGTLQSAMAHNANEYDPYANYQQGDCCYVIHQEAGVTVRTIFQRVNDDPDKIVDISPMQEEQTEWVPVPSSEAVHLRQMLFSLEASINYILEVLKNLPCFLDAPVLGTEEGDAIITEEEYGLSSTSITYWR